MPAPIYAAEYLCDIVSLGNIDRGQKTLLDWQVGNIGSLPRSLGDCYILTVAACLHLLLCMPPSIHYTRPKTTYVSLWHTPDNTQ
jgi:hypothetical protein